MNWFQLIFFQSQPQLMRRRTQWTGCRIAKMFQICQIFKFGQILMFKILFVVDDLMRDILDFLILTKLKVLRIIWLGIFGLFENLKGSRSFFRRVNCFQLNFLHSLRRLKQDEPDVSKLRFLNLKFETYIKRRQWKLYEILKLFTKFFSSFFVCWISW